MQLGQCQEPGHSNHCALNAHGPGLGQGLWAEVTLARTTRQPLGERRVPTGLEARGWAEVLKPAGLVASSESGGDRDAATGCWDGGGRH